MLEKSAGRMTPARRSDVSLLSGQDLYLFNQGRHYRAYNKLGAHLDPGGAPGTGFGVWAPNARAVREGNRFPKNRLLDSVSVMMRTEIGEEARCLAEEHGSRFCLVCR